MNNMTVFARNIFLNVKRISSYLILYGHPAYLSVRLRTHTMKYLNVAEKNDAAKNIASHLSQQSCRRREGKSKYNKIYEFEANVMGVKSQMVMTSVSGHLYDLEFVDKHTSWEKCRPESRFEVPVSSCCYENYLKIKQTLELEIRSCNGLIIWTDCDREGENIGFEIIDVCKSQKRNLRIYRAKFSEITYTSIHRALTTLGEPNENISAAVDVRRELDLRIGAAFTRLQTLRLQNVFPRQMEKRIASYGSCQFPTLGFVVERYRAIEQFVSEAFWKITVNHTINNLTVNFIWDRGRLFDKLACEVINSIVLENPRAKVVHINTQPKSKWRPLPLDTVELEKIVSRKLKINAKETMRLAEKLYTQGFISYPRTETNQFTKDMNLTNLVTMHTCDANWGPFAQRILDDGGPTPRQGKKTDMAHPPIHPTKHTNSLSGNELRLYEFIVRSFLACCSKDAQGQETTVKIKIANETFTANGLMIIARNYLDVYPYDKWSSKEIHCYEMNQTFVPTNIGMVEGATSPPNLLTEADLIALMEKHGIGTDATHAEHIEKIKDRSYVEMVDNLYFNPGVLGMGLVESYDAMGLEMAKPHLRAQLENDLKDISEGKKQKDVVLAEQLTKYKDAFMIVQEQINKMDQALALRFNEQPVDYNPNWDALPAAVSVFKCPKCDADMQARLRKNKDEYYIGCQAFPRCKNAVWLPNVVKKIEILQQTCPTCGPGYHKIKFEWRNNSLSHLYPRGHVACVGGCDRTLLEHLGIHLSSVRKTPNTTNDARSQSLGDIWTRPTDPSNNRMRSFDSANETNTSVEFSSGSSAQARQNTPSVDIARDQSTTNRRMPTLGTRNQNELPAPDNDSGDNVILCHCSQPARLLTARTQNENYGKQFYKCSDNNCNFFCWDTRRSNDGPSSSSHSRTTTQSAASRAPASSGGSPRGWFKPTRDQHGGDVVCTTCGRPVSQRIVRKEGPNHGRPFYSCTNSSCNFFEWADGGTNNNNRGAGARGARGGRAPARGEGAPRRCGLCRAEGHNRNRCPQGTTTD